MVDAEGAAWAADRSHLVGSTASMARIRRVLAEPVGLAPDDVRKVTEVNPGLAIPPRPMSHS
jgi:hypothetical protein